MLIGKNQIIRALRSELNAPKLAKAYGKFVRPYVRQAREGVRAAIRSEIPQPKRDKKNKARLRRGIFSKVTPVRRLRGDSIYYESVRGRAGTAKIRYYPRHLHLVVRGTKWRWTRKGYYRGQMKKTYPNLVGRTGAQVTGAAAQTVQVRLAQIVEADILSKIKGA